MKAQVFSHEKLIGTTELIIGDGGMGVVSGEFFPNENYYKYVQESVWEFWSSNKPDYIKWNTLRLNVQLDNECFLFAAGGFIFEDLHELPKEPKRIDVAGVDRYIIEDFLLQVPPKSFVAEPWEPVSIGQKIAFEDELKKEIGLKNNGKSFLNFFRSSSQKHILADFEFDVVCHHGTSDDVLFRIMKKGVDDEFAVVHLTWRGGKESVGYPRVKFFRTFDEFKDLRMRPDKADWGES